MQASRNTRLIACIVVKDNKRDGKGGYAKIVRGGIGQPSVEIRHQSQSGGDIDFIVTIYAERQPAVARPPVWYAPAPSSGGTVWAPVQYT